MAKIGFEYIVAGQIAEDATSFDTAKGTYTDAREIGPGATVTVTPSSADVKDYGDDRIVETDVSVTGGTISLELNEPTLENEAWILGHTLTENGGILRNTEDIPPYVGIGFVGKSMKDGARVYRVKTYLKTQFTEPSAEYTTKEDNVTFNHTTLEGNLFELENHDWNDDEVFDTLEAAKAYVDEFFAVGADSDDGGDDGGDGNDGGNGGNGGDTEPDDENP